MKIAGLIIAIPAFFMMLFAFYWRSDAQALVTGGKTTSGIVRGISTDADRDTSNDGTFNHKVFYEYSVDGTLYNQSNQVSYSQFTSLKDGQEIAVTYLPSKPYLASVSPKNDLQQRTIYVIGFGFLFLVGCFVCYCGFSADGYQAPPTHFNPGYDPTSTDFFGIRRRIAYRVGGEIIAFGLVSGLFLILAFFMSFTGLWLHFAGTAGTAYVTKKWTNTSVYEVDYSYHAGNQKLTGDARIDADKYSRLDVCDTIPITYIASDPMVASLDPLDDCGTAGNFAAVGVVCGLLCIGLATLRRKYPYV